MDEETLTALRGSIKKWEKIVDGSGIDRGPHNCPLCRAFYAYNCRGCPVAEAVDDILCAATPYEEWADETDDDQAMILAQQEVDFLKSLLPKGEGR
jgi:hypothetical protein